MNATLLDHCHIRYYKNKNLIEIFSYIYLENTKPERLKKIQSDKTIRFS